MSGDQTSAKDLETRNDYLYKCLIIGDSGVGKSSLLERFVDDSFRQSYVSTVGVDFKIKTIQIDNKIVKLQIWDTAGKEKFKPLTSPYYRGAHGFMVVYDVTQRETYANLQNWLIQIETYADEGVPKILIGNKIDLESDREIFEETGRTWAMSHDMSFIETSAKWSQNVQDALTLFARLLMNNRK